MPMKNLVGLLLYCSLFLKMFCGHLEDIVSHKNTQYQKVCVYLNVSVYIRRDFSSAIEMYGRPFCFGAIPTQRVLLYSLINRIRALPSHRMMEHS